MICPKCRNTIADTAKFCTYCGSPVALNTDDVFFGSLPAGITKNNENTVSWSGECRAIKYKRSFLVPRWVVGILFLLCIFIINFGIFPDDPFSERVKPMLVVTAIAAVSYLLSCVFIIANRDGVFHGEFSLTQDSITVREIVKAPEGGFYGFIHGMFFFISLIVIFSTIFSDNNAHLHNEAEANAAVYQSASYKKVKLITPSPDKSVIIVKAGLGKLRLLVTPVQCDYIVKELEDRCRRAGQQL